MPVLVECDSVQHDHVAKFLPETQAAAEIQGVRHVVGRVLREEPGGRDEAGGLVREQPAGGA